jgi:hypothetical protein
MCPDGIEGLDAALATLGSADLDHLTDPALAEQLTTLRQTIDRLEAEWQRRLTIFDRRGEHQV